MIVGSIWKFIEAISKKKITIARIEKVLSSGMYVLSEEVSKFESQICKYHE